MNFQEAVIFLSAVVVIVSAGVVLGAALKARSMSGERERANHQAKLGELYAEIIGELDEVSSADERRKQWFIHRYYQALVMAPDNVLKALNQYLDAVAAMDQKQDATKLMELRGEVVQVMRKDIQKGIGRKTKVSPAQLYKIEVRPAVMSGKLTGNEATSSKR